MWKVFGFNFQQMSLIVQDLNENIFEWDYILFMPIIANVIICGSY